MIIADKKFPSSHNNGVLFQATLECRGTCLPTPKGLLRYETWAFSEAEDEFDDFDGVFTTPSPFLDDDDEEKSKEDVDGEDKEEDKKSDKKA